ncbi:MAG TPA: ATP-dependent DNA helicase RecG [Thermoclostridium sp.]|nr:ATP-dependent DNA helicase RecG [Thermoclostridium sp.]
MKSNKKAPPLRGKDRNSLDNTRLNSILHSSVQSVKQVGPATARKLNKLGIDTIGDLITYYPRDYEDRNKEKKVFELLDGDKCAIILRVLHDVTVNRPRRNLRIYKTVAGDESGIVTLTWFNQDYIKGKVSKGSDYVFFGKVKKSGTRIEMINPIYEEVSSERKKTSGIQPIYSLTAGITQSYLRMIQKNALERVIGKLTDILPDELRKKYSLSEFNYALENIHFPVEFEQKEKARRRLVFEELLMLQLGLLQLKNSQVVVSGIQMQQEPEIEKFIAQLPYQLTNAQQKVFKEIVNDMTGEKQANRLIQGDVGSGKTIVAVLAILLTILNGYQAVFMVPTGILAEQHYQTVKKALEKYDIAIELLTGSITKKEKERIKQDITNNTTQLVIGTHALLEENVEFAKLGLVVTDEQHRFGVKQRAILPSKSNPHIIVMTATPIPRTLSLILYGDLDISIIDELPPNRKSIKTYSVDDSMRNRIYQFIRKIVNEGRQTYIICPLVEESEEVEAEAAMSLAKRISENDLKGLSVGLVHGKMKALEKDKVMAAFAAGNIQVLVSTTVVEVGVNVPNASLMVIENAERFGLAQLHQLRGRVGRGEHQSYCILFCQSKSDIARKRMEIMTQYNDGFMISEKDMELRGPGDIFGTRQHGLPEFKIANLYEDIEILKEVQKTANDIIEHQRLKDREDYKRLQDHLLSLFQDKMDEVALN